MVHIDGWTLLIGRDGRKWRFYGIQRGEERRGERRELNGTEWHRIEYRIE